ncbi:hypothetical protein SAY87_008856 [Trapa incisa]|uniref:Uncharacterized protein n=1 Tax=Trapa incisa TaxID=236973 RepID=A0AAN7JYM1_9MYRT|nr:hypothetical protein SAY87_008856 [Trapa incisa]
MAGEEGREEVVSFSDDDLVKHNLNQHSKSDPKNSSAAYAAYAAITRNTDFGRLAQKSQKKLLIPHLLSHISNNWRDW